MQTVFCQLKNSWNIYKTSTYKSIHNNANLQGSLKLLIEVTIRGEILKTKRSTYIDLENNSSVLYD